MLNPKLVSWTNSDIIGGFIFCFSDTNSALIFGLKRREKYEQLCCLWNMELILYTEVIKVITCARLREEWQGQRQVRKETRLKDIQRDTLFINTFKNMAIPCGWIWKG